MPIKNSIRLTGLKRLIYMSRKCKKPVSKTQRRELEMKKAKFMRISFEEDD
jgi:hypothetical protein